MLTWVKPIIRRGSDPHHPHMWWGNFEGEKGLARMPRLSRCHCSTSTVQKPTQDGDAHWRHRANTTEPTACCGNAALCQITFTTCTYIFTFLSLSHHCKALNSLICADAPLRNYTHSLTCTSGTSTSAGINAGINGVQRSFLQVPGSGPRKDKTDGWVFPVWRSSNIINICLA